MYLFQEFIINHNGPVLEFEKPIYELEKRIEEMRNFAVTENMDAPVCTIAGKAACTIACVYYSELRAL